MGFQEDRDEFNSHGLRGLVRRTIAQHDTAFIKILAGGHQGELVATRPEPGSGSYLHYQHGEGVFEYRNATPQDTARAIFRVEI